MLTLLTETLSPTIRPGGFAVAVIVTVVPPSVADVITVGAAGQVEGSAPAHIVPGVEHPGTDAIGLKASVAGS
jgi:hypothetical protein